MPILRRSIRVGKSIKIWYLISLVFDYFPLGYLLPCVISTLNHNDKSLSLSLDFRNSRANRTNTLDVSNYPQGKAALQSRS